MREAHAHLGQPIQARCRDQRIAVRRDVAVSEIIRQDHHEVRPVCRHVRGAFDYLLDRLRVARRVGVRGEIERRLAGARR